MTDAVAYLRVSTREQGKSGLGLEAQRATIERVAAQEFYPVVQWYTEVQSGKGFDDMLEKRPQLMAALAHAEKIGGVVIVSKLDRLSRDVHFISGLMVRGVEFRCCDLPPEAPKFMLHIFAVLAEWERDRIAERTKEGLAAAKEIRGRKLGSHHPERGGAVTALLRKAAAAEYAARIMPYIVGDCTLTEHAKRLNAAGFRTPQGKPFTRLSVARVIKRANYLPRSDALNM